MYTKLAWFWWELKLNHFALDEQVLSMDMPYLKTGKFGYVV
jgi:hypothetical protein